MKKKKQKSNKRKNWSRLKNQRKRRKKLNSRRTLLRQSIALVSAFGVLIRHFVVTGIPPEYWEYAGKGVDLEKCKQWLQTTHPGLYDQLYPATEEGEEEKKEAEPGKGGGKKKKGVKFGASVEKKIKVVKQSRGGKKMCTSIWGLDLWGVDLTLCA